MSEKIESNVLTDEEIVEIEEHDRACVMIHQGMLHGIFDHGLMHDPNHPGPRFPSSRDWNMPTIKCNRKTCAANYNAKCIMPSLLEIGSDGKCKGYKKRK